jgi:predicted ATP-grasp superfamily ATP-dependent carboligase
MDMMDKYLKKRILITGARSAVALDLSRHFMTADCEVYLADSMPTIVSGFSNTIKEYFPIPSPRYSKHAFIEALLSIIKKYKIDLLIPTFEETYYIAQYHAQHPIPDCSIFCSSFEVIHNLHNKWLFQKRLNELGFLAIPTQLIQSIDELQQLNISKPYIIKACYSRASLSFYKIDHDSVLPPIHISPQNSWVVQPWLNGKKYCTYSVCNNGIVQAHSVYPVNIAINGNSCILFEAINHPEILQWVIKFVEKEKFTGQIAFDFIETVDGLYAIECNPRATSGVHLFIEEDKLATAFLNINNTLVTPQLGTRRQILMGMLLYGWQTNASNDFLHFLKHFLSSADVIFDRNDLKPFFMQPFVFIHLIRLARKLNLSLPAVFNHDLEWNG